MAVIKALDLIATKWATVTPARSAEYESGVKNPRADWARNTSASSDAWKTGVQTAIAGNLFQKGVNKAGNATWQDGAVNKGVPRWGQGVALAQDKYQERFAPFHAAIARVTLPPRGPRRDPRNLDRVKVIVDAMIAAKKAIGG